MIPSTPGSHAKKLKKRRVKTEVTFRFHDARISSETVIVDESLLPDAHPGDVCQVLDQSGKLLFMFLLKAHPPELKAKLSTSDSPLQMSVLSGSGILASHRGSRKVAIRVIDRQDAEADLLSFYTKDIYLTRTDMWRIPASLVGECVSQGQSIEFIKSLKLTINAMHKRGRQVKTSFVGPSTRAVFRSYSVRYLIFIQMSREMWFFDETGESYFYKIINSFLPELFRHWREADAQHLVSIVMFTSVDLSQTSTSLPHGVRSRNVRDHYRIVVDRMKVSDWTSIMAALRREFSSFLKEVLVQTSPDGSKEEISGTLCPAIKGNILEAINLAATQASRDLVTDDSQRGNVQTIIVSPASGVFDVEANLLHRTTQILMAAGLSIDIMCLTRMPLHVVPLFRYRDSNNNIVHCMPHWVDISFWRPSLPIDRSVYSSTGPGSGGVSLPFHWVPRCRIYEIQMMGVMENELSGISIDYLPQFETDDDAESFMDSYDDNVMRSSKPYARNASYGNTASSRNDHPLWTTIQNPSNPTINEKLSAVIHGNWKHIFPRRSLNRSVKWRSMVSPASLPVTTETFPSADEFFRDFSSTMYEIKVNPKPEDDLITLHEFIREMVSTRIGSGFQIVIGSQVEEIERLIGSSSVSYAQQPSPAPDRVVQEIPDHPEGIRVYLSMGTQIHRLACISSSSVVVQIFRRRDQDRQLEQDVIYRPLMRTATDDKFITRSVRFPGAHSLYYNWLQLDQFIFGLTDCLADPLLYYRMRFVLIPTELQSIRHLQLQLPRVESTLDKMNPEEIRLDGLRKLNANFFRSRYKSAEEKRRERDRKIVSSIPELKFYTSDLSAFITQLIESAGEDEKYGLRRKDSLITKPSERFDRSVKLSTLAQEIQGERGIRLVDRRWHWKLHQHCFVGSELVAWLIENFKDIDTPEEAVEYGNELMIAGMFHHVEHRHSFLDGHYFYQINPEYSLPPSVTTFVTQPSSADSTKNSNTNSTNGSGSSTNIQQNQNVSGNRTSWFASIRGGSSSSSSQSTAAANNASSVNSIIDSTKVVTSDSIDSNSSDSQVMNDSTMSLDSDWNRRSQQFSSQNEDRTRPRVELSKAITIDVDPQHKSYRRELVTLHYDRLHNPVSCYHIQLEWLNTTPKLIEEAIAQWSRLCDRSGLKLVEVPVTEACLLPEIDPFASLARIQFGIIPPNIDSTGDAVLADKLFFHKQALMKLDYVLDTDAASTLEAAQNGVDIVYSWGKPHFKYAQYVHKTGATLAQLVIETGEFLITRNPLWGNRSGGTNSSASSVDPEQVRKETIDFILNRTCELEEFFQSIFDKYLNRPALAVPYISESPTAEAYFTGDVAGSGHPGAISVAGKTRSDSSLESGSPLSRTLSSSPASRRPPPPPPSDTTSTASYIYYDFRML
ncbi:hypothetical protein V1511DRAFT_519782 [Dipodascopsis uninucleata]